MGCVDREGLKKAEIDGVKVTFLVKLGQLLKDYTIATKFFGWGEMGKEIKDVGGETIWVII